MHIYRLLLLSLLVGLSNISVAQYSVEVKVESRQTDAPPEHVYLYAQEGNNLKRLRALPYPSSKRFTIKQIDHMGLYWIGTSPATLYPIMLGKDQQVSGEMRFEDGVNEFTFDHADQNAYKAFMLRKKEFEAAYKELNTEYTLKLRSLKTQEAKHTYQVEIMQRTDEMARNYNKDLKQMAKDHPGTYTADYLAPIAHTHIPDRSKDSGEQMQERKTMFFSGVDFTDPNIIYNAYLHLKLFQFFNENRSPQMGGFTGAIDYVMKRQALHPKVANFMANYFIEAFGLRGPDQALQYVVEEYGDMITDTTMGVKLVLEREENLKPGKPALEMAYPDTSGNMRKLRDNLGSQYTLLFIWSSTCGHCIETLPTIEKAYMDYNAQGLNVYGVAIDPARDQWLNAMRKRQLPWVNVISTQSWESSFVLGYGMRTTPFMAVIDPNGNLVEIDVKPEKLATTLRNLFEK